MLLFNSKIWINRHTQNSRIVIIKGKINVCKEAVLYCHALAFVPMAAYSLITLCPFNLLKVVIAWEKVKKIP